MKFARNVNARGVPPRLPGVCFLLLVLLPLAVGAQGTHTDALPRVELAGLLGDSLTPRILVLGTPHLSTLKGSFNRMALDSLLVVLQRFRPQVIAVETLPPDVIGSLENEGGAAREVVEWFAGKHIKQGATMQRVLGCSRERAMAVADSLAVLPGRPDINTCLLQVASLLASYDYYSALLQWSYLPGEYRIHNDVIPDSVSAFLNNDLVNPNEIISLALPLARRLMHQRVVPIDDHTDDQLLLPISDSLTSELQRQPLFQEVAGSRLYASSDSLMKLANSRSNLLPYYLYLNSPEFMSNDISVQWGLFLRTHLHSGFDRYRYALWEVRNLRIAGNVMSAAPLPSQHRVLVIIGAAHKPFVEAYLHQMPDLRLLQLQDILK